MKVNIVEGEINTLGPHLTSPQGEVYDYIQITEANGGKVHVQTVLVENLVDADLRPGLSGVFVFRKWSAALVMLQVSSNQTQGHGPSAAAKNAIKNQLIAYKTGAGQVLSASLTAQGQKASKVMAQIFTWALIAIGALIILASSFSLPGLVFGLLFAALGGYRLWRPSGSDAINRTLAGAGFDLSDTATSNVKFL